MNDREYLESLVRSIKRPGCNIDAFLSFLNASDFYKAPASTKYHLSEEGGLCKHLLLVYNKLKDLVDLQYKNLPFSPYDEDSLIIVALCSGLFKINYYERYAASKKVYRSSGMQRDALGKFDWESELSYRVKDANSRFLFGSPGETSFRIASEFFPLSDEEAAAIIWRAGGMDDTECNDLCAIFAKYPLVTLLHTADFLCTYVENNLEN